MEKLLDLHGKVPRARDMVVQFWRHGLQLFEFQLALDLRSLRIA